MTASSDQCSVMTEKGEMQCGVGGMLKKEGMYVYI